MAKQRKPAKSDDLIITTRDKPEATFSYFFGAGTLKPTRQLAGKVGREWLETGANEKE